MIEFATGRRFTYSQLRQEVDALALGLLRLGITKGDRSWIWAPNCAEWMQLQYATAKIGAILVCINPAYRTHELQEGPQPVRDPDAGGRKPLQDLDYACTIADVAGSARPLSTSC